VLRGEGPGEPFPTGKWIGTLMADGFYRANWKAELDGATATLTIDRFTASPGDPEGTAEEVEAEGAGLLTFIWPEADERRVVFAASPPWGRR
jgi:hypothetical protein